MGVGMASALTGDLAPWFRDNGAGAAELLDGAGAGAVVCGFCWGMLVVFGEWLG